jgi:ferric-dicitrate binding protein FerR (iron transport regulator)
MKSRIQKYKHYRDRIARTPENKFPARKTVIRSQTHADKEALAQTSKVTSAVAYPSVPLKKKTATPYGEYSKKQRTWLLVKSVSFVLVVAAFVCLYFFWVKAR